MKDFLTGILQLLFSIITLFAWAGFAFAGFAFLGVAFHVTSIQLLIIVGMIVLAFIIGCAVYAAVQDWRKRHHESKY
ncbi:hypothetical protein [Caproicibacterium amylolyticum]|uniref:Uncharacterized protein n=1 Tax=Caproicibacterium amylolyticum TaxID=2766537 RepID=A0A7G9WJW1_9FIRM|nr:hypothetical protein [Caproicibacterium amylolyticum]QNO18973.1 hypothetical protein H6X83_04945 [Caproicibacterium amylolyticum]